MNPTYSSIFMSLFLKVSAYLAQSWWILPGPIMKLWIDVPSTLIYSFFFLYILMSPCKPLSSVWISLFYKTRYLSFNLSFGVAAARGKKKNLANAYFALDSMGLCHLPLSKCAFILEIPLQPHSHCFIFSLFFSHLHRTPMSKRLATLGYRQECS